ncbi:hypothetical protein [Halocola ammonii]
MRLKTISILSFIALMLMTGCNTTEIIGSWEAPDAEENVYNSVMVTGLTSTILPREQVEREMVDALNKEDVYAAHSLGVITNNMNMANESFQDSVVMMVDAKGFDALLTITLLEKETEARYVPGTVYDPVVGYPYYNNFWGYYSYNYGVVYDPGYYNVERDYYIEANLYDADSEEIIWSAQTRTHDPGTLGNLADDFAKVIAEELDEEDLLMEEEG